MKGLNMKIGFVGAGRITSALVRGLVSGGFLEPGDVMVNGRRRSEKLREVVDRWGVRSTMSKATVFRFADVVIMAVKPQDMGIALEQCAPHVKRRHVIISLAAAIPTTYIAGKLGPDVRIVRAMTNTSCVVRESATAICLGAGTDDTARDVACSVFSSVGKVWEVDEAYFDAVTGLSGSGPAFIYYIVDAMQAAGSAAGLPPDVSRQLAIQTLLGAGRMMAETGQEPGHLVDQVASPRGTTLEGLRVLRSFDVAATFQAAIHAAAKRSAEIEQEVCGSARSVTRGSAQAGTAGR
ncbi:MAG: pyrroline-5-carboxylate reductase [Firmicutes bacterium]|jgi:pyrroline-5-carboxylate reductase|nr:pyrroline-5-carboxylate reductase [Bacillota bacterium]